MSSLTEIKAFAEKVVEQKKQLREQASTVLKTVLQEFLQDWPEVKTIMWTQYTPYFNDGDTCTFNVNDIFFCTDEERTEYEYVEEGGFSTYWSDYDKDLGVSRECFESCKELSKLLTDDLEDELKFVFGDHISVIVNRTGVDVEEYEHD